MCQYFFNMSSIFLFCISVSRNFCFILSNIYMLVIIWDSWLVFHFSRHNFRKVKSMIFKNFGPRKWAIWSAFFLHFINMLDAQFFCLLVLVIWNRYKDFEFLVYLFWSYNKIFYPRYFERNYSPLWICPRRYWNSLSLS